MRFNLQRALFLTSRTQFPYSHIVLSQQGTWSFLSPLYSSDQVSYTIWHQSRPILKLNNGYTSQIIQMITGELYKWLDPHSLEPVALPSYFQLSEDHVLIHRGKISVIGTEREAIQVIFDYADFVGHAYGDVFDLKLPCHMRWVDSSGCAYPEPDISNLLCDGTRQRTRIESILAILRYPGLYDGSADLLFERRLGLAIRSLFATWCPRNSSTTDGKPTTKYISNPLIVISESAKITEEVCVDMAKDVHPTLLKLLIIYGDRNTLPSHCFVYGLHISPTHISILAHFPESAASPYSGKTQNGRFCQVLLAKFYISYPSYDNDQDDSFLQRWRLFVALFTVLNHVELLEREMSERELIHTGSSNAESSNHLTGLSNQLRLNRLKRLSGSCRRDLQHMRSLWKGKRLSVPSSWITPDVVSIATRCADSTLLEQDRSIYHLHQTSALIFHHIRKHLLPLDDDTLMQNHISDDYAGADFIHSVHVPCSCFQFESYEADKAHEQPETLPYYFKARDFLSMAAYDWADVNMFIANIFAGASACSVQWHPVIRYPFPVSDVVGDLCAVDFALAARAIPPTTRTAILRAPSVPLTVSSPAVLLGVRSTHLEGDGRFVSQEELSALLKTMEPHLNLFRLSRHSDDGIISPCAGSGTVNTEPTLFCIYVKTGFVHILAFSLDDNATSEVSGHLLDSLPLSLHCETERDVCDRMRIVLAMLTLQRQVVKICDGWNSIFWSHGMLVDEHEAIVEVTGLSTPTPSADWSSLDSEEEEFALGLGLEYSTMGLKQEIEKSMERVIPWLAQLICPDNEDY